MRTPFKTKGSSPLKGPDDDRLKAYQAALDSVTADMTDKQLRNIALSQHRVKGVPRGGKWAISMNTLLRQRRTLRPKVVKSKERKVEVKKETPPVTKTPPVTPSVKVVEKGTPPVDKFLGVMPEHDDPTWYTRESTADTDSAQGRKEQLKFDKLYNVKRSDLQNPEIMKQKNINRAKLELNPITRRSGFKMKRGNNVPGAMTSMYNK